MGFDVTCNEFIAVQHLLPRCPLGGLNHLDIVPDSVGVPHVHYKVSIGSANQQFFEEQRTLGLESFAERFKQLVTA